jgi:hypothetical protein
LSSITEVTAQPNNRFGVYKWETPEDIQVGDTGREGTYKKLFRRRNETEVVFLLPIPKDPILSIPAASAHASDLPR